MIFSKIGTFAKLQDDLFHPLQKFKYLHRVLVHATLRDSDRILIYCTLESKRKVGEEIKV